MFLLGFTRFYYMGTSFLFWSRNRHKPENLWAEETFFFLTAFLTLLRERGAGPGASLARRTDGPDGPNTFFWGGYFALLFFGTM